jgi:uncharacterized protein YndB with AHSA1/START domain
MRMSLVEMPSTLDTLLLRGLIASASPETVFAYWIEPHLLLAWWPQEVKICTREGGAYHFGWPGPNWHLRGRFTAIEPGQHLAFTWHWDHEPGTPERHVEVRFTHAPEGTVLTIRHGTYTEADTEERQGHREGWTYFFGRLEEAIHQTPDNS